MHPLNNIQLNYCNLNLLKFIFLNLILKIIYTCLDCVLNYIWIYSCFVNKTNCIIILCSFSGNQLHDVEFKVGETIHHMDFCGHFTGHAFTGQRIAVYCPHKTIGRYVQLKIVRGNVNQMTPAEVLVWGVRVRR